MTCIYDFSINSLQQQLIELKDFQNKVLLLVNTASQCGLTPQYEGLQALHEQYAEDGLVIIGFPCNQFRQQEPGDASEIQQGCLLNYGVSFPITEKIDVNGQHTHPIFAYLKTAMPGVFGNGIKWNFTKFLIGRDGTPIKRFAPITKPATLEKDIQLALGD